MHFLYPVSLLAAEYISQPTVGVDMSATLNQASLLPTLLLSVSGIVGAKEAGGLASD